MVTLIGSDSSNATDGSGNTIERQYPVRITRSRYATG